jgi:integrase/recombinase XerD
VSPLHEALADYLSIRRAMGYKLERAGKLLAQFVDYLDHAEIGTVTVEHALAWSMLPAEASVNWWAHRLSVVRGFARWLTTIDPATQVPPTDLLPWRTKRAIPYPYSDDDLAALLAATETLSTPLRAATYRTLLGLLAVTGMRLPQRFEDAGREATPKDCGVGVARPQGQSWAPPPSTGSTVNVGKRRDKPA